MTEGIEINFVRVRFPNEFFFDKVKTFNVEDFELGKKWAKSLPHPYIESSDLWEFLKNKDSVEILEHLNEKIRSLDNLK